MYFTVTISNQPNGGFFCSTSKQVYAATESDAREYTERMFPGCQIESVVPVVPLVFRIPQEKP